jgi:hypothetical protein
MNWTVIASLLAALGRLLNWFSGRRLINKGREIERNETLQAQIKNIRTADAAADGADVGSDLPDIPDDGFRRD